MPFRQRGFSRRRRSNNLRPVDSNKNIVFLTGSTVTASNNIIIIALTVDNALLATATQVERGCTINNVWMSLDVCGLNATGINNQIAMYIMKDPGTNLTPPLASTEGTSNEKKFIFWERQAMVMRNQDGNNPYHWEGWIKIPKVYRRFGADDRLLLLIRNTTPTSTGHFTCQFIYKWYK